MALYGGERDISLFKSIDKELLHKVIDTEVLYYKLNLNDINVNVYDETSHKTYFTPVLVHALANVEDQQWTSDESGPDVTQPSSFAFLRDDLVLLNIPTEAGDIIEYRSRFFEVDAVINNQNYAGKDPENWFGGTSHGYNVSIVCQAHMTRQSKLSIVETRFGNSVTTSDIILPTNL